MYTIVYQCTGWSPCPFGLLLVLLVFVLSNGPLSVFCGGTSLKCQKPIVCDVSAVVLLSYCLHWSRHALQAHPPNVGQPNICPQKGWSCTLCQCGSKRCFPNGRKLWNFLDPQFLKKLPMWTHVWKSRVVSPSLFILHCFKRLVVIRCRVSMLPKVICCNIALLNTRIHHHTPKKGDMGVGQNTLKSRAFHPRIASTLWMFIPFWFPGDLVLLRQTREEDPKVRQGPTCHISLAKRKLLPVNPFTNWGLKLGPK